MWIDRSNFTLHLNLPTFPLEFQSTGYLFCKKCQQKTFIKTCFLVFFLPWIGENATKLITQLHLSFNSLILNSSVNIFVDLKTFLTGKIKYEFLPRQSIDPWKRPAWQWTLMEYSCDAELAGASEGGRGTSHNLNSYWKYFYKKYFRFLKVGLEQIFQSRSGPVKQAGGI